ncbi:MAG TPA: hypothetical protein PKD24_02395 [Pyrinomonadaceae bacterium]|nr:hypothetical protein [Pyrinomonadaceae bacterium]
MKMTICKSILFVISFVFLMLPAYGQTLVLPGMPQLSNGQGECAEIYLGIASENWRVRKGDTFEISAFLPFQESAGLQFTWTVSNGKIVSGQGTQKVSIKAGKQRTPGFINASGFVGIKLTVVPNMSAANCSVNAETSVMIGKNREMNGFSKVEKILLSKEEITTACSEVPAPSNPAKDAAKQIKVTTVASDPENDPLLYLYVVSAGTILGRGANVVWDLSEAIPGIHRIMVGTDDGNGIHSVRTATIKLLPCAN